MNPRYDDDSRRTQHLRGDRDRSWFERTRDAIRDTFDPEDRDEFRYGSRYRENTTSSYRPYHRDFGYGHGYGEGFRHDPAIGEYRAYGGYGGAAGDRFGYHGRGPKGFRRTDERIREDVAQALTESPELDATEIELEVEEGCVVLKGTVPGRRAKRLAEDLAERVWGVVDVRNELRPEPRAEDDGPERHVA